MIKLYGRYERGVSGDFDITLHENNSRLWGFKFTPSLGTYAAVIGLQSGQDYSLASYSSAESSSFFRIEKGLDSYSFMQLISPVVPNELLDAREAAGSWDVSRAMALLRGFRKSDISRVLQSQESVSDITNVLHGVMRETP